jgi:hypothetical protein
MLGLSGICCCLFFKITLAAGPKLIVAFLGSPSCGGCPSTRQYIFSYILNLVPPGFRVAPLNCSLSTMTLARVPTDLHPLDCVRARHTHCITSHAALRPAQQTGVNFTLHPLPLPCFMRSACSTPRCHFAYVGKLYPPIFSTYLYLHCGRLAPPPWHAKPSAWLELLVLACAMKLTLDAQQT